MFNYRDQADGLRRIMAKSTARIISVLSAQGQPVTPWVRCLAGSMLNPDQRLLLVEAQRAPTVACSLQTVVTKRSAVEKAILRHPQGYDLACLSENNPISPALSPDITERLDGIVKQLAYQYDTVMIEAQLDPHAHQLPLPVMAAHELVIQMDRSDEAMKSAYLTIKHLSQQHGPLPMGVVITDANNDQGKQLFLRLNQVCKQFLGVSLAFIGAIPAQTQVSARPAATALAFNTVAHRLEKHRIAPPAMAAA